MYHKRQLDLSKEEDQVYYNELTAKYKHNDLFRCSIPFKMKKHFHTDPEVRYFCSGSGRFVVDGEIVECTPGTLLEISKGAVHTFEYDGGDPLLVHRWFSDEEEYKEYYIED